MTISCLLLHVFNDTVLNIVSEWKTKKKQRKKKNKKKDKTIAMMDLYFVNTLRVAWLSRHVRQKSIVFHIHRKGNRNEGIRFWLDRLDKMKGEARTYLRVYTLTRKDLSLQINREFNPDYIILPYKWYVTSKVTELNKLNSMPISASTCSLAFTLVYLLAKYFNKYFILHRF